MSPETTHPHCPQCQAPLAEDAPQGLCPACLMAMAALPTDQDTLPLGPGDLPELADIAAAFPELEIVEKIGQGGMGVVFKARQPKLDRTVALKVLPKALAATPGFAERFTREGRVLARLSHPSIVAVHDFGESGGYCFLIMEYVDGVNLRQAMKAGRFTPDQALKVVPDICTALQAAHEQGVLHRDIKPENILLDSKGRVKIADFGIAKLMDDRASEVMLTQSGARLGTAPYMAPEQLEQPSSVDHRADIYSLGVVLYEMLTGELPLGRFAAPSEKAQVSEGMDAVVMRALEKERGRRQQSAGEMRTQIEGAATQPCGHWGRQGVSWDWRSQGWNGDSFEYKSKRMVWGLPLVHVAHGRDPGTGRPREAHGFFAFGDRARGIFAFGGIARGWVACGGLAFGGIALGGVGVGLVSISGLALALLFGMGGLSLGFMSLGGVALGWHASGGVVIGWHALGGMVFAHQGAGGNVHATVVATHLSDMPALTRWMSQATPYSFLLGLVWVPLTLLMMLVPWWARQQLEIEARGETAVSSVSGLDTHPHRIFWLIAALDLVLAMGGLVLMLWLRRLPNPTGLIFIPMVFSGTGLVMFALSLPLWMRLVPVNPLYGVHLPATMKSSKRWYDVNAYAGKQMFFWSLAIIGAGIAGFFQLPRHQDSYSWAAVTLTLVAVVSLVISTLWWTLLHPEAGSKVRASRLIRWGGQAVVAVVIALFIQSFVVETYKIAGGAETGITKGSHWLASRLDTGFAPGDLIVYEHDSGHTWIARVVKREQDGLLLKRGGSANTFFVKWDKVIGKMMFSHFTPDALGQAALEKEHSSQSYVEPLEGTRHWDESRSPELKYLQLKRRGDKAWHDELYDTQGLLVQDAQALRQVKESFPGLSHTTDEHMVLLWFDHADFDGRSLLEINLLDESGKLVRLAHGRPGGAPLAMRQPPLRSCSLILGRKEKLPRHITVELGFSAGPWQLSNKVMPQFQGEQMLSGIAGFVTATGNDDEERALVSWHNGNSFTKQVDCYAILKSGRKVGSWERTAHGVMLDPRLEKYHAPGSTRIARLESVNFQVPLSEVQAFQFRHRPLMLEIYKQIVVPPLE